MSRKTKDPKSDAKISTAKGLLAPPISVKKLPIENRQTTRDAMDELLDETFNSDSLDEEVSLVGLDDLVEDDTGETPILAGPTSPEARARRYKKLREDQSFWDELERLDEEA